MPPALQLPSALWSSRPFLRAFDGLDVPAIPGWSSSAASLPATQPRGHILCSFFLRLTHASSHPCLAVPCPPPCHWNSMLALKLGFWGISVYSFRRRGSACEVSGPAKPAGEVWWCLRVLTPFVETFRATSPEGPPPGPRPTPSPSRRVSCPQTSSVATHSLAGPFFMKKAHF